MSPTVNILLMLAELWFFSGVVLLLHRYSDRIGLAPLMVTLGGITAALQTQSMGWVEVQVGNLSVNPDSYVLLPVLLLGLLVVYVVDGTHQARVVLAGVILVTAMVGFFQLFLPLHAQLPGSIIEADAIQGYPLEIFVGSVVALIVDMILLIEVPAFQEWDTGGGEKALIHRREVHRVGAAIRWGRGTRDVHIKEHVVDHVQVGIADNPDLRNLRESLNFIEEGTHQGPPLGR